MQASSERHKQGKTAQDCSEFHKREEAVPRHGQAAVSQQAMWVDCSVATLVGLSAFAQEGPEIDGLRAI